MDFTKLLSTLFGNGNDLGGILGSEGFKNLLQGGMSLYNGMQMGDMLDFQKDLAGKADARTDKLFQEDQDDRKFRQNLDFTQGAY